MNIKKFIALLSVACVLVSVTAIEANAALSCTYEIIYDANGNITNGKEMLAYATANRQAAEEYYNGLKKSGTATELELQQAADAVTNAKNIERWWIDQVNNSKAYLGNIKDREKFEDDFINNRAALADLTKLQQAKTDADNALEIANAVLTNITNVKTAITNYTNQLAEHPEYAVTIEELNKKLEQLNKEYAEKSKIASEKQAIYETYLKTLNYAAYDRSIEDNAHAREINRVNPEWKP